MADRERRTPGEKVSTPTHLLAKMPVVEKRFWIIFCCVVVTLQ